MFTLNGIHIRLKSIFSCEYTQIRAFKNSNSAEKVCVPQKSIDLKFDFDILQAVVNQFTNYLQKTNGYIRRLVSSSEKEQV